MALEMPLQSFPSSVEKEESPLEFIVSVNRASLNRARKILVTFIHILILFMHNNNEKIAFEFHFARQLDVLSRACLVQLGSIKKDVLSH